MNATATDYQVGAAALAAVIAAAVKANVPAFLQGDVPAASCSKSSNKAPRR
jgi:hypothetical protein